MKHAFGSTVGFISAWMLALDQAIMVSYGTIDAAKIISKIYPFNEVTLAAVFSTALFLLTLLGIRESARVAKVIVFLDLVIMTSLIVLALAMYSPSISKWSGVGVANVFFALSLLSRGFTGVDAIGQLAGEVKKPSVLPKAALLVIAIATFQAVGLSMALTSALGPSDLRDPAVAPLYLAERINPLLYYLAAVNLFAIMLTAALTGYLAFSRLMYKLAESGVTHPVLCKTREGTPYVSLAVVYAVSLLFISVGEVEFIIAVYALGSLANYLLVTLAVAKFSKNSKPFGIPIFVLLAAALVPLGLALAILEKLRYMWVLGAWLAAGGALYIVKNLHNSPALFAKRNAKIVLPSFSKFLSIKSSTSSGYMKTTSMSSSPASLLPKPTYCSLSVKYMRMTSLLTPGAGWMSSKGRSSRGL